MHQVGERDVERSGDLNGKCQADVLAASLYATHVRTVDAGDVGKGLLRKALRHTPRAHCSAERYQLWCEGMAWRWTRHEGIVLS